MKNMGIITKKKNSKNLRLKNLRVICQICKKPSHCNLFSIFTENSLPYSVKKRDF